MCYNVLCDKYATRQLYGYCPSWALNWEYRKKAIMQEILSCNADIISLQVKDILLFLFPFQFSRSGFSVLNLFAVNGMFSKPSEYKRKKKEVVFRAVFAAWHQKNAFQPTQLECEPAAADQRNVCGGVFVCACEGIIDMFSNKRVRIIVTLGITQIHLYFLLKIRILLSNLYSSVYLILMFLFFSVNLIWNWFTLLKSLNNISLVCFGNSRFMVCCVLTL